ncbi:hypothetical protein GCM10007874_15720 [Labrys miyagiensis]|uniref:Transposase n=1 Tax=Labrys miyagiensis TaxID=346912 RepID=A0ABQ6CF61_9HYPH|nr:hypothetical protein GCM10007874_15720 [Labrys miyagiensis]
MQKDCPVGNFEGVRRLMRGHYDCKLALSRKTTQRRKNECLVAEIKRRSRFIEQQNICFCSKSAGYQHELAFSA